ncbi:MAG: hypothetical protein H6597_03765 [Flavobacteriales bacterium]|nr:hypothetical protein [Flavobacteriales bacterium]MCB9193626.1 hypothetical protein [Flavobacteriales bacterium]
MRLLKRAIPFLATFIGAYLIGFWALCHLTHNGTPLIFSIAPELLMKGGDTYQRFQEFDPDSTYDVVFLGSSHAYRGYDPAYFTRHGYAAFNLGSSAQSQMNSYYLLKDLVHPGHVRLVVLDVYEGAMESDAVESTSDLVQNIPSDATAWRMALALHDPRGLNMLALRYFMKGHAPFYRDPTYRAGGGALRTDSLKVPPRYDKGRPLRIDPLQAHYLQRTVALCRERNIPLVLSEHYFPHASDQARHAAYTDHLRDLVGPDGPVLIDKAYDHHLSDRDHFFDRNHLNAAGAELFSADLLAELQKRDLLPTR